MQINQKNTNFQTTHEGALAKRISNFQKLKRSVMCCMLWEDGFYEDGNEIAERIKNLVPLISFTDLYDLVIEAKEKMHLRHIPLYLTMLMCKMQGNISELLYRIITRPDDMTEFMAMYWAGGKCPVSSQVKKGLAKAFAKFNEYSLAKYNRKKTVNLKDILKICHPKPLNQDQSNLWKKLLEDKLEIPDTWEIALSTGKDKKETWTRLINENKLGDLAILRNLRNMQDVGVNEITILKAIKDIKNTKILPFQFIISAGYAPRFQAELEQKMFQNIDRSNILKGKTILLIDVSGSMQEKISEKSDLTRSDAAKGLAILAKEICEKTQIYTFNDKLTLIPNKRTGFALSDLLGFVFYTATYLGKALNDINRTEDYDRIIVFTDEQSADTIPNPPKGLGYIINVSCNQNGVAYGKWTHIDGFSQSVINYIQECEKN